MTKLAEIPKDNYLESSLEDDSRVVDTLKFGIKWWESKRWIFNVLTGMCGIFMLSICTKFGNLQLISYLGIIIWGLMANLCYSLGILIEVWNFHYFRNALSLKIVRYFLFGLGTIFSCLLTIYGSFLFSLYPYW